MANYMTNLVHKRKFKQINDISMRLKIKNHRNHLLIYFHNSYIICRHSRELIIRTHDIDKYTNVLCLLKSKTFAKYYMAVYSNKDIHYLSHRHGFD
eukprot:GAHX01002945.1.p1 GENE.GAHX01002945.1~~GAHX01002945.1.p1  ORF type:complete len:96 (+),score=1.60 GAHX01002945.1:279-566(+)